MTKKIENSLAYRSGWIDGCCGEFGCFTENPRLSEWKTASERLDYFRGHCAGREASRRSGSRLRAP